MHESAPTLGTRIRRGLYRCANGERLPLLGSSVFTGRSRTRLLVFRPSTRAEIADIFAGPERHGRLHLAGLCHLAVNLFEVRLDPAYAGDFNLAVLSNPEGGGNVRQAVGIRGGILLRVVEQDGESDAEFLHERCRVLGIVLRDRGEGDALLPVGFVQALEKWECVLAGRTRHRSEE